MYLPMVVTFFGRLAHNTSTGAVAALRVKGKAMMYLYRYVEWKTRSQVQCWIGPFGCDSSMIFFRHFSSSHSVLPKKNWKHQYQIITVLSYATISKSSSTPNTPFKKSLLGRTMGCAACCASLRALSCARAGSGTRLGRSGLGALPTSSGPGKSSYGCFRLPKTWENVKNIFKKTRRLDSYVSFCFPTGLLWCINSFNRFQSITKEMQRGDLHKKCRHSASKSIAPPTDLMRIFCVWKCCSFLKFASLPTKVQKTSPNFC